MKKLLLVLTVGLLSFSSLGAPTESLPFAGPFKVNWTVIQQVDLNALVGSNGTHTASSTNVSLLYKSTEKKFSFGNASLLALLANSFDTNFPSGAGLATDTESIFVVDKTGTNVILNVSPVFTGTFASPKYTLTEVLTEATKKSGTVTKDTGVGTETAYVTITYNDSAQTTKDGTHSNFTFTGVFNATYTVNYVTGKELDTFEVSAGAGYGTLAGVNSLLTGTSSGDVKGIDE